MSSRSGALLVASLLLPLSGCSCEPEGPGGRPCVSSDDCGDGRVCIDDRCTDPPDGGLLDGRVRDGGFDGRVGDGSRPDGGCDSDDDCGGGYCVAGGCCPTAEAICGTSCCSGDEVCFASACVVPGRDCRTVDDCDEGQYCEPGLGDGAPSMDGGMPDAGRTCAGEAPRLGRCVELPPRCEDIGGTPGEDYCITDCEYRPEVGDLNAVVQWHWGPSTAVEHTNRVDIWATPAVGRVYDTNCDGTVDVLDPPNVVFVSGNAGGSYCSDGRYNPSRCLSGALRVLDGRTGAELWTLRRPRDGSLGFAGMSVALGDVTGDGTMEIVAASGEGYVVVVGGDGTVLHTSDAPIPDAGRRGFGWGGGLSLGDMDGDGAPEIAYGATVFTTAGGAVTRLFTGAGGIGGRGISRALSTFADVGEDADLELVAGRTVYRMDGTMLWNRTDLTDGFPAVGDLDLDGSPEIVLVSNGRVTVLEGSTGATELGPLTLPGSGFGGPPTIADFDGDGAPEIGVAQANFYAVVKANYAGGSLDLLWQTANHDYSSSVTGSTVFDFEGDGIAEVVYNDECFLWVYDGPTGDIRFATPTNSFTATEASLVADVDGDGHAEMLMIANGADPSRWHCAHHDAPGVDGFPAWTPPPGESVYRGIWALRDASNGWVGTRPLWNQHTYHVTNVCSDRDDACVPARPYGAIPERERTNWSVPWLNNFRQNVQGQGLFDAPDATVSLAVECTDPPTLVASVRNLGAAILPDGVEVGFYVVEAGTERMLGTGTTTSPLFPSQAEEVRFTAPADVDTGDTFRARILVDPSMPPFRECREDNNDSADVMPRCVF